MSLRAPLWAVIPDETARVAQAAFPKGNPSMRMRDALGPIYYNPDFAHLFSHEGRPAEDAAQLALITIMQFAEGLSDTQAADAVRGRIDWKYALALDLTDAGFDSSVLSEFRARLIAGQAEHLLFETMLTVFRADGLIKVRGRQRTDSTHILAAVQMLNRLECVGETLRHALNILATVAPEWVRSWVPSTWFDRYSRRFAEYRLPPGKPERYALAAEIGADGRALLTAVVSPAAPAWLRDVPAIQTLRQVWIQQYYAADDDQPVQWRTAEDLPPATRVIGSPYDPDARYGKKRTTEWTGYKVHLTETADDETPHLLTDVTTTAASISDVAALPAIQAQLANRDVGPSEHIVDAGSMSADRILTSRADHAIDLIGPVGEDQSWQTKAGEGFAASFFVVDWEQKMATCPSGRQNQQWLERKDRHGHAIVQISFRAADCQACPLRPQCTKQQTGPYGRSIQIRDRDHVGALQTARERQRTAAFRDQYAARAGIEGTISQGVRISDLRRTRYVGLAKTRLLHLLIGAAMNFMRVAAWLAETPRASTRQSAFARLGAGSG